MLNTLQRQVLEATFDFVFSSLKEDVPPDIGLMALNAIKEDRVYQQNIELLKTHKILEMVNQVRAIYAHPYPQNRSTGSPYVGQRTGWVAFEPNGHNRGVVEERQGLLGLTALSDRTTPKPTKEDVNAYLDGQIDACRIELQRHQLQLAQQATSHPREVIEPLPDFGGLVAFIQATIGFYEAMQEQLISMQEFGEMNRQDLKKAAATYMTSVLNAIRKEAWESFLENPEYSAIPSALKPFIVDYLKEHPILRAAKIYESCTKQLEAEYVNINQNEISLVTLMPTAPIPRAVTPFWTVPSSAASTIDIKVFVAAVCNLAENLKQKLAIFSHLNPDAANTYVSNLITAIRKNQVQNLFEHPELHGIPAELKEFLAAEFQPSAILLQGHSLGAQLKEIETALAFKSIKEIRQSWRIENSSQSSDNNNNNANAGETSSGYSLRRP